MPKAMRVLIVADEPYAGLHGRQQRLALGLAQQGHHVLYLNPPPGIRRVAQGPAVGPTPEPQPPSEPTVDSQPHARLCVIDTGTPQSATTRQDWTIRSVWDDWANDLQAILRSSRGPACAPKGVTGFGPEVTLVYPPAMLKPARGGFSGPLVFDCREDFPGLARSRPLADAYTEVLNEGLPLVDGMVAVNRYLLESWGRLLPDEAATAVVEHGVDTELFGPPDPERKQAIRTALELGPDRRLLCYLGRADERLSYEDLQTLLELDAHAVLGFVGEVAPEGRDIFRRLPQERIVPLGPVPPRRAADVVAAADVLIFPFRREPHLEGVRGLKLYEYFATGLPVLATFRRTLKVFRDVIYLYATREELEEGFERACREPADSPRRRERVALAQQASWDHRVGELVAYLQPLTERGTSRGQ